MFKKQFQKLKKDQKGLTLVELLAVVVILAIVAAIAFVVIGNVIENSRKDAEVGNAQQMINAAKLYESSGGEISADGVSSATLQEQGALSKLTDPWTKERHPNNGLVKVAVSNITDSNNAVTGKEKVYSVELAAANNKCTIEATEEQLNKRGRDVCSTTPKEK